MNFFLIIWLCILGTIPVQGWTREKRSTFVTFEDYGCVELGATRCKLVQNLGSPYAVRMIKKEIFEYEYIERPPSVWHKPLYERHYYFLLINGIVMSKCCSEDILSMEERELWWGSEYYMP